MADINSIKFIDKVKDKGNFWFVEIINKDIYEKIYESEKNARINFKYSGNVAIRDAFECMIRYILEEHKLKNRETDNMDLNTKVDLLRKKDILPSLGIVKADIENGTSRDIDYYDFLRRLGNACSHEDIREKDIKINYIQLVRCLKGLHLLMKKYYTKRVSKDTPDFMENFMPIGKYSIEEAYVPEDTLRSRCIVEYMAYTREPRGSKAVYAILRLYNKEDLNENFMLRNSEAYLEASKFSISSVPEGMTTVKEPIAYDSKSSYYMIAYEFNRQPHKLTSRILKDIQLGERVKMCKMIADSFYNLHTSQVPIYHRMISDDIINLCNFGKLWVPYIIKFDFAKIVTEDGGTVIDEALNAKDRIESLRQKKYLAPEWINIEDPLKADWEKIDIYSLGVLFSDILMGKIEKNPVNIKKLQKLNITKELSLLIDNMRSDAPDRRYDIEKVRKVLSEEVAYWD